MMWYGHYQVCIQSATPRFGIFWALQNNLASSRLHISFFIPEISPLLTTALNPVSQLVGDLPPACHEPYQENTIINLK